jgi:hypothetical protein
MRRDTSTLVKSAFATVLGILSVPHAGSAQQGPPFPPPGTASPFPPYIRIQRGSTPCRLAFFRPIWIRRSRGFSVKFKPSSIVILQSGRH